LNEALCSPDPDPSPRLFTSPPWAPAHALSGASYSAAELAPDGDRVWLLEQRELPGREVYVELSTAAGVAEAIRSMVVRGAPAIGIAAAYGMVLAASEALSEDEQGYREAMRRAASVLASARPTAVNLSWAVKRALLEAERHAEHPGETRRAELASLARAIHIEDVEACRAMGHIGALRMPDEGAVLTHCNAGALATGGYGTALGVIRAAIEAGKRIRVLADETRPYLQGARLTAWELAKDGIPVEVITDSMAGYFMRRGEVRAVIVGADRIARSGDVANKIGTYGLACLAKAHGIPFYVAAPWSTIDLNTLVGAAIPIEERSREEVARIGTGTDGQLFVPEGVPVRHPAFDVTPADLITSIFTERGEHAASEIGEIARGA
jgi:methylthioribose-1-phosphate isomerase